MLSVKTPHASTSYQRPSSSTSSSQAWLHIGYCVGTIFTVRPGSSDRPTAARVPVMRQGSSRRALVEPEHLGLVERLEVRRVDLAAPVRLAGRPEPQRLAVVAHVSSSGSVRS